MSRRISWRCLLLMALASLAACTHAPVVDRPAMLLANPQLMPALVPGSEGAHFEDGAWWREIGGEPLHNLVEQGLRGNTDIAVALTRVREARAGLRAREAALLPSFGLNGAYDNKRSGLPQAIKQGRPDTRVWQASLELDWEPDLFGRNQSAADAAQQDVLSSEAGVAGARLMLISEVARQFVLNVGAVRKLALLDHLIALQAASQTLIEHQAREGEISAVQVEAGRAQLQELQAQRPALLSLQSVTRSHLARLTSSTPEEVGRFLAQVNDTTVPWHVPGPTPTGQPIELLARRPDIIAARATWRAELARLDSANTDLLPRFFLSLLTGRQDLRLNGLALAPVGFNETTLAFALPIFNAGRVQAGIDIQDATAQRAELRYEQAIRQAADDVESALAQFHQSRDRVNELDRAVEARKEAATRGQRLFDEGQISALDRVALEQAHVSSALNAIDSQESARLALIQLHQALGGGWRSAPSHNLDIAQKEARP
ncbi:MAG: TolC family protein [Burkholderiales bacterium]|nr:MAG: TolC family protein [Burkholderiales bacterium]